MTIPPLPAREREQIEAICQAAQELGRRSRDWKPTARIAQAKGCSTTIAPACISVGCSAC
jgi:hypothetical protein